MEELSSNHLNSIGFTSLGKERKKNGCIYRNIDFLFVFKREKELEVRWVEKWVGSWKSWSKE